MIRFILKKSRLVIITSFIIAIICLFKSSSAPKGYEFMWVIPFFYSVFLSFSKIREKFFSYLGISIMNVILFVRYVIIPLFSSLTGIYNHSRISTAHVDANYISVFVFILEMFSLFIALHFITLNLEKLKHNKNHIIKVNKNNSGYIIFAFLGLVSYFIFPAISERISFLIADEVERTSLNTLSSLGFLLATNAPFLLFLWFLSRELIKFRRGEKPFKLVVLIFAFIGIVTISSLSRLTILAQGIAVIALLHSTKIFRVKSLYMLFVATVIAVISLTSARIFNSGAIDTFQNEALSYFDLQMTSDYLQAYFGGLNLISEAIHISPKFSPTLSVLINEMTSSILFVRQLTPLSSESSTVLFNSSFGFIEITSMILPTLGQSYMYFGIIGAPLLSLLLLNILYRAECKLILVNDLGEKFAYYILVIWLAFFPMQNLNIITATIFNTFLPLYILVKLNNKFSLK